uniref:CN hydrolase domain-containing protein n=1 Tax=Polytomella parva TaxID=51329 RepID=A0A7S0URF8_9CHLO|mmetsp:Transcript_18693/g.33925  ORF Transcript_18693/g.33925 Transcript_18693/m.33925 type:complete len:335 (+) Transcript_18693:54-1058(+)
MTRKVSVAVTQFACCDNSTVNIDKAEELVRASAKAGAQIILLQELFESLYFCQVQDPSIFLELAAPFEGNCLIKRFSDLAADLNVVIVVPFFERADCVVFNSAAVIDADGSILGRYRKSHIPDGSGYQEKFYFSPGDSGFLTWPTRFGILGVAICWDQWFPETARVLALKGAEIILYPTAIGSEPLDPGYNSYPHWIRTMQGHSAANLVPVVVSNRIGHEQILIAPKQSPEGDLNSSSRSKVTFLSDPQHSGIHFYGGSFITDATGAVVAQVGADSPLALHYGNPDPKPKQVEGFAIKELDLDECQRLRRAWGVFRDRRPDLYGAIGSLDGSKK